jgi:hypothetical protein
LLPALLLAASAVPLGSGGGQVAAYQIAVALPERERAFAAG